MSEWKLLWYECGESAIAIDTTVFETTRDSCSVVSVK